MEQQIFTNEKILAWLSYFADNAPIELEKVKLIDVTRKNKNLIPTVESHRAVMVFTQAGAPDIFYRMWNAGLGDCEVWYNEGSEPVGEMKHDKLSDMISRGINAYAGMLVINDNARNTYKIGMDNHNFRMGSIQYVGSEIRAILLSKMNVSINDDMCIIGAASIAMEAALIALEGSVTAVEYSEEDRNTVLDNVDYFGLHNVNVIDHVDEKNYENLPVPSIVFLVASASMEQELEFLTKLNPNINIVVYTLDFNVAAGMEKTLEKFGYKDPEIIQVAVSKLNPKHSFVTQPAPWIITAKAEK